MEALRFVPHRSVRQGSQTSEGGIEPSGKFLLVHVATPLEVCEQRDRNVCTQGRAPDWYETPADAEVTLDTTELSPEEAAQEIILHLEREAFIGVNGQWNDHEDG
jgi:sulfate adenylyltransferase